MDSTKIGYFIPEFPGQTHIFFWREMKQLRDRGVEPEVVSTRRPAKSIISHSWAEEAISKTEYLFPPTARKLFGAIVTFLGCGPAAWFRVLGAIAKADVTTKQRIRLAPLSLLGAGLLRLARKRNWSHLHVHSCADAANIAMFAKLLGDLKYGMTLHGPLSDYGPNQIQKWTHSNLNVVITNKLAREAREKLGESVTQSVELAPMGVDLERFTRTNDYRPWNGNGPFRIFCCGRINPCKGHEYLIEAVSLLRSRGIDAQLTIAGAIDSKVQDYSEMLHQRTEELGITEHVSMPGAVSEEVVQANLEGCHAFALASLHEPLGVVYMEAMAMSIPTIGTNAGGVAELITDGADGLLVEPKNAVALADALEDVAANTSLAESLGARARNRVEKDFHSGVSAQVIANHIHGTAKEANITRRTEATLQTEEAEAQPEEVCQL